MKKNSNGQTDNIVLFPGLKQRLYEKGMSRLEAHDFQEAIHLLQGANELDPDNPRVVTALLVATYEDGHYHEAKLLAEELLHQGIGDYYEILDIYLMILIQVQEHEQVIHTIETLFEEREVPPDRMNHFQTLLQLSQKVITNPPPLHEERMEQDDFLKDCDLQEQVLRLGTLMDKNIHPYVDYLVKSLEDQTTHPFVQTMILNVLRENRIEKKVFVKKVDFEGEFIPALIPAINDMPMMNEIVSGLENRLEDHNPVLLSQLKEMVDRHTFILYPFDLRPQDVLLWIIAYLGIGYEMYGENWNKEKMASELGVDMLEVERAVAFLSQLEQLSSPIV